MLKSREYSLDVLKMVATIIIIFHHYQQITGAWFERGINFWGDEFYWGYLVELFFILSGYFSCKYVKYITVDSSFCAFFKKKYFRFIPMIAISGMVCLGIEYVYYVQIENQPFPHTLWSVITSLLGITRWLSCDYMANNPMWYISVLLLCNVIFFFITYIAKRTRINPYILYCIVLYLGVMMRNICNKEGFCYPFFSEVIGRGYSCFFLGLILQRFLQKIPHLLMEQNLIWELFCIIVFIYTYNNGNLFIKKYLWYILCFGIFPLIIVIFKNKLFDNVFGTKKLKYIGDIAYNAFIWHLPIIRLYMTILSILEKESIVYNVQYMLIMTALIFIVGGFSYFFIDINIRKLSIES